MHRELQLRIPDAVALAREVAGALHHAHERGVVHRDIKPANILLQGELALVADLGIAFAVQQEGGQRMTQTGLSLGTPQYMAPEQAMGEPGRVRAQGHAMVRGEWVADVWAVAAPVRNHAVAVTGAITVGGPRGRVEGGSRRR